MFYPTIVISALLLLMVLAASLHKFTNKYLNSFRIQESIKIFKAQPNSRLNVFNGFRAFAMFEVIYGHYYMQELAGSMGSLNEFKHILHSLNTLLVEACIFSVDIFFYLGGFFVAFVILREKSSGSLKYPVAILQRALRFWPCYLYCILLYYSVYIHTGSGPFWGRDTAGPEACSTIWRPLLFIDNLVDNGDGQCMGWGWYIQNDMQMFIVSMLGFFIYDAKHRKSRILAKMFYVVLLFGSLIAAFIYITSIEAKIITSLDDLIAPSQAKYQQNYYIKPWFRWPVYIFGLLLGIFYM